MRTTRFLSPLLLIASTAALCAATGSVIVDDTFAAGNSQLQDLPNNSLWLFNGRNGTVRADKPGSVAFDITNAGGSEGFWGFFTDSGSPVVLGIGDKLTVSGTFSLAGFQNNGQDIRFGVLNSLGTRNTANLASGMNDATFVNDTGYGLDFVASGSGAPFVIGRRTTLINANVFNNFGDFAPIPGSGATVAQALANNVAYTLTYTIERVSATDTRITATVTGGSLSALNYSSTETSTTPNTSFDYFAFRVGGTNFASKFTFTEWLVQYSPAAPVITSQPQPASLTVQVGGKVSMTVGASGSSLSYQWRKDGQALLANASAASVTLNLTNVQHTDAGSYTALVSNSSGSAVSNPVTLSVSDTPVAPLPTITTQPANTSAVLGGSTTLFVTATGSNLFYQWSKNGALIPNATAAQLAFSNAQIADSGTYSVTIGNSSGSVQSAPANLLVVSAMSAKTFAPANLATGVCVDSPLSIQFDKPPVVGSSGQINIYNSHGVIVDTINLAANPQTRMIGGSSFVYLPVIVNGNTAVIYPHQPLPANDRYAITVDPGAITDASGAPFGGFYSASVWSFGTRATTPATGAASLTVAADGSGDFCTVQAAIDFVPANNTQPVAITVQPGTYNEINYVPSNKPFITVRGQDREATIIQYADNANLNNGNARTMFGVDAPDFTLENITLINTTPHGGSQAEAFRGGNQRILLNRVNLKSFQDTLLLNGSAMVTDSYIEGDVDFMWGNGAAFFQNCELKAVTSGGYYTQIRNGQGQNGNVYVNCRLTSLPGVTGAYLGRIDPTVFPYSQAVYINCAMDSHILPVGWQLNNSNVAPNVQDWEYRSMDLSGALLDVSQRLSVSRQISAQEAAQWSDPGFVLGGWVPYTVNAPEGPVSVGAAIAVDWSAAPGHSASDSIKLYTAGDPDSKPLASQNTGGSTTGHLTFAAPPKAGLYEFRYFQSDGVTKAAVGNRFAVQ